MDITESPNDLIMRHILSNPRLLASMAATEAKEKFAQRQAYVAHHEERSRALAVSGKALREEVASFQAKQAAAQAALAEITQRADDALRRTALHGLERDAARREFEAAMHRSADSRINDLLAAVTHVEHVVRASFSTRTYTVPLVSGGTTAKSHHNGDQVTAKLDELSSVRARLFELQLQAIPPDQLDAELDSLRSRLAAVSPRPLEA